MNNLKKCFCILGYPGSGKGAQSEYLSRKYGLFHIDIGEQLRKISRKKSPFGKDVDHSVHRENSLVPDVVVRDVLSRAWNSSIPYGVIIDGAPRRLEQKSIIEDIARERGAEISGIILLNVDPDRVIERIRNRVSCLGCNKWYIIGKDIDQNYPLCPKCGMKLEHRLDDTPEGIQRRIVVFEKETKPVISAFRREGKLIKVSANGSIEDVRRILDKEMETLNL